MVKSLSIRTNILNPVSTTEHALYVNHVLTIDAGRITGIAPATIDTHWDVDMGDCIAIPGLIDTHVHLSQYRIKGHYRDALLPWLKEFVFPEELKSADYDYAYALAQDFFQALYKNGTTTAVIYTAPYPAACEAAFEAARLQNFRAFIGMTLMNQNSPAELLHTTTELISQCRALIKEYHNPASGWEFILTPRFAPTCSMGLMEKIAHLAQEHDLWIQTHLSENKAEIAWVKELFGLDTYTEVYQQAGLLTPKTILAHCLHLTDAELSLIKESGSKISHCPDSNFFLKSGKFPLDKINEYHLPYALGSDVGAGTSLNMLYHAKMYNYTQTQALVTPEDAFYHITLGAAKLLNLDKEIGSIALGKSADIVLLKFPNPDQPIREAVLSELVFTGHEWNIEQVYAKGIRQV